MISAMIFDLDGVLVQTEKLKARAYGLAVQKIRNLPEPDDRAGEAYREVVGASREITWQKDEFVEDFVFITDDAADFLVDSGVRLVGVDYLSVGSFKHGGSYVHKTLLSGGIWTVEGLNLSNVAPGKYDLICLPLRIVAGDGAPARAVLKSAARD